MYKYIVFKSDLKPSPNLGFIGDIWIQTTVRDEYIFYRGLNNIWKPWIRYVHYESPPEVGSQQWFARIDSAHPWLADRYLQFDGITVGWHSESEDLAIGRAWDLMVRPLLPPTPLGYAYETLTVGWIARFIIQRQPLFARLAAEGVQVLRSITATTPATATASPTPGSPSSTDSGTAYSPQPSTCLHRDHL